MSQPISERPSEFPAARPYPGDVAAPSSPPAAPPVPRRGSFWRYALPAALFVVAVAGIAWVTQFMPTWRSRPTKSPGDAPPAPETLAQFAFNQARWDKNDPEYVREMEKGTSGFFDFPFENVAGRPLELGLLKASCDCTHLQVCFPPEQEWRSYQQAVQESPLTAAPGQWSWKRITKEDVNGIDVPPGAKGLVRIEWETKKEPGAGLRLALDIWIQPKGESRHRQFERLEVPVRVAPPARIFPDREVVGTLGPRQVGKADFTIWSSTRAALDLTLDIKNDPLLVAELKKLSSEEMKALQDSLRKKTDLAPRVLSAYRLHVVLHEQKGEQQLEQGPIYRHVPLLLEGGAFPGGSPLLLGLVRGDVEVGAADDQGKLKLGNFVAKDGIPKSNARRLTLRSPLDMQLEVSAVDPATLDVRLHKAGTSNGKADWLLEVTVPPGGIQGPLPEHSAIILRTQINPPRFLRIPVVGNGQS